MSVLPRPAKSGLGFRLMGLGFAFFFAAQAASAPLNIVFFLVDDQRFDALGIYHDYWETPHMDALARNGILFENAFVTTSLCSPSRASILSGQYAHRHKVMDNRTALSSEIPTFPKVLQHAGYDSAFVGKWHMGGASDAPRPGFDRWVSFRGQGAYNNQVFNVDGEHVQRTGYTTDIITEYAEAFIRAERDPGQPFSLYVSHKAAHAPFTPAERHAGSFDDRTYPYPDTMANTEANYAGKPEWVRKQRDSWHGVDNLFKSAWLGPLFGKYDDLDPFVRDYAETLRAVDDSLGRIVAVLREEGLIETTLIVVTSDNGYQLGEHGLVDKRTMYESSIKVPLIVHCPKLFSGGERRSELILNIDFAPTFIELAGQPIPESMQGRSFYGLLTGTEQKWREAFLYEYFWERAYPQTPTVLGVRTETHKFMKYHGVWDLYELYDIVADPGERNNLLAGYSLGGEPQSLDEMIRRDAGPETKSLFNTMDAHLRRLLRETGAAAEPNWVPQR